MSETTQVSSGLNIEMAGLDVIRIRKKRRTIVLIHALVCR